jgi:flagellin
VAISINSNPAAAVAAYQLSKASELNDSSLTRLSSGSRIVETKDDPAGCAVDMKLSAALRRTTATISNVANTLSFLQTQASALQQLSSIFTRMSEVTVSMQDMTKSEEDLQNYVVEMRLLASEIGKLQADSYNGTLIFDSNGSLEPLVVLVSEDGSQTVELIKPNLGAIVFQNVMAFSDSITSIDPTADFGGLTLEAYRIGLEEIATMIGENGANQTRLTLAMDALSTNQQNLESAKSRIADLDIAAESTRLTRGRMLVEVAATMLRQANANSETALKLISG